MTEPLSRLITELEIQDFVRDGAISLRGLFSVKWVERLNAGIEPLGIDQQRDAHRILWWDTEPGDPLTKSDRFPTVWPRETA
jgi:hypothetical protein